MTGRARSAVGRLAAVGVSAGLVGLLLTLPGSGAPAAAAPEPTPTRAGTGEPGPSSVPTTTDAAQRTATGGDTADADSSATDPAPGWQASPPDTADGSNDRIPYPGDPEAEAQLVAADDRRLTEVGTIAALATWSGLATNMPYRLATGSAYTLLLTPRRAAYTVEDLLDLAPQTFVREPDGSYLLSENIVVQAGATLDLAAAGRLVLRLASDEKGFVSIVNDAGRLIVSGSTRNPVVITSWDRVNNTPDRTTVDGRAYIRSIGGQVSMQHVELDSLGFWSGRTGGLSLTGTDRPNTGQLDDMGKALKVATMTAKRVIRAKDDRGTPSETGATSRKIDQLLPAGTLPVPEEITTPAYSYASASIHHVTVTNSAFGLFVASADGVDIRDSQFSSSLVDGLVMHRYVTNAVVQRTESSRNAGDGIVLARATTGIVMSEITAADNRRNGVTISGLPLATGPSATGTPVASYGNNALSNSASIRNGRYGVEVIGGSSVSVQANDILANELGIVVREGARKVSVVGNRVKQSSKQGIAVRDGVSEANIAGNVVEGGTVSLQVRDSAGLVRSNTLLNGSDHGVSIVGRASGLHAVGNVIAGRGPSAVDVQRSVDLDRSALDNDVARWDDTTPWLVTLKRFLQPLTMLWLGLAAIVLVTALRGLRRQRSFQHPYAATATLPEPLTRDGLT